MIGRKEGNKMVPPVTDRQFELHSMLKHLVAQGECLQMTTNYKGMTLSQKMTGIFFDENCIRFNPIHQVCCNKPGQKIFIHHKSLQGAVATTISGIDMIAGVVTVSHFEYSDHSFQTRKQDRVQPRNPIRAVLAVLHTPLSACLVDISEEGLGASYYRGRGNVLALAPGLEVRVGLRLPNSNLPLYLTGTITRSRPIGSSTMTSIGIQFKPNEKQAIQIKNYVKTRQAEILDELSYNFRMVMEPNQTKDLYF
jgi:hypothetical protein